jgi:uncharacterized protein (TIGR03083 family)
MVTVPEMSRTIEAVRTEAVALAEFLKGLDLEDWSRDSACSEWKVGDIVAHLSQGAMAWSDFIARALAGDTSPPPGQQTLPPGDRGSEITAQRAIELRQSQGPQELLNSYITSYDQLYHLLQGLKPGDRELPCFHRRGVVTVRDMVGRRVQELAVHGWDIRSNFDPWHQLSESAVAVVVGLAHLWLANTFCPRAHAIAPVRYRFQVSGPAPVLEDVVVYQDRFEVEPSGNYPSDVTFRGSGNDYLLLIYGRLNIREPRTIKHFEIDGSKEQAELFNTWFRGV